MLVDKVFHTAAAPCYRSMLVCSFAEYEVSKNVLLRSHHS